MSETVAPTPVAPAEAAAPAEAPAVAASAPPTPSPSPEASGAGPATVGVTPPEAGGESPAPAVSSEPAPETPADPSILSAATEAETPEPAAEAPAPEAPAEPVAAPTYEFKPPEGVTLDPAKVGTFSAIVADAETRIAADPAQAHAVLQEFGQKLVELHIAEAREAAERYTQLQMDNWKRTNEDWQAQFRNDPEIGKNRQETTLLRMGALMDMYGREAGPERLTALRDILTNTGAGNNLEVLRWTNWMARKVTETSRVVVPMMPRAPQQAGSKAERLYGKSLNGAA